MKAIHVGILTPHRREFIIFSKDNPILVCTYIQHEMDLERETFDYFIRLDEWERLDRQLLSTVRAIEKIRSIDKAPLQHDGFPRWDSRISGSDLQLRLNKLSSSSKAYFDELMNIPTHPMCRGNIQIGVDKSSANEAVKKATEVFTKMREQWAGANLSMKDATKGLIILPDETSGTP